MLLSPIVVVIRPSVIAVPAFRKARAHRLSGDVGTSLRMSTLKLCGTCHWLTHVRADPPDARLAARSALRVTTTV